MPPAQNDRLNHAPDKARTALLLIDVINPLEFDGGEKLLAHALRMAVALAKLKRRAKAAGIPAIYVNDNFGRWRSDFATVVQRCLKRTVRGRPIVTRLKPQKDDYFVLKPKHSAFFQTNLETLLDYLGATTIILTGMAGDICVLFSANDACMRDFRMAIPSDCVASEDAESNRQVLMLMQRVLKADITPSPQLKFRSLNSEIRKSFPPCFGRSRASARSVQIERIVIHQTSERPWPRPQAPWVMFMRWRYVSTSLNIVRLMRRS